MTQSARTPRGRRHALGGKSLTSSALVAALLLLSFPVVIPEAGPRAEAAFPGRNGRIAFSAVQTSPFTDSDIFTVEPSGGGLQQLTSGPGFDCDADWSPDGSALVFSRDEAASGTTHLPSDIYVTSESGTTNLTNTPQFEELGPSWSPDGTAIVFSRGSTGSHDLYLMDADGGNVRPVFQADGLQYHPAWSPDGRWIAYVDADLDTIGLIRPDGRLAKPMEMPDGVVGVGGIEWSPDGRRLAFTADQEPPEVIGEAGPLSAQQFPPQDIWTVKSSGEGFRNLTKGELSNDLGPAWSPDGTRIAFISNREEGGTYLYTMSKSGESVRRVVDIEVSSFGCPTSWGPRP